MTKFAVSARMVTLAAALIVIGSVAYLWAQSLADKSAFFGPGCAAEFSC